MRVATIAALMLALALGAPEASAGSFSWSTVAETKPQARSKSERAYRVWMRKGEQLAQRINLPYLRGHYRHRLRWVYEAVQAFEAASAYDRTKAEPHLRAAELLYHFLISRQGVSSRRDLVRALHHYNEFERKAPHDPRVEAFLFGRGLAYTKLGDPKALRRAVADYDRYARSALFTSLIARDRATTLSNLAEVHMMLGDLDEAIINYQLALRQDRAILAAFGLAVALDRDGQEVKARELLANYVTSRRGLGKLEESGVFFVPAGEVYYYKALGHEVLGHLDEAIANWQRFIRSGAHPRYQPRAKANLAHLLRLKRQGKKLPVYQRRFRDIHP